MKILTHIWRAPNGKENLGDYAMAAIIEALGHEVENWLDASPETKAAAEFVFIPGSTTFHRKRLLEDKPQIYWGGGFGADVGYQINPEKQDVITAVRGPVSTRMLRLDGVPEGDLTSLLPQLLPIEKTGDTGTVFVPHWSHESKIDEAFLDAFLIDTVVSPLHTPEEFNATRQAIKNASFVFATSLHGAAIAHFEGIPWCFVDYPTMPYRTPIKQMDFAQSIGVTFYRVRNFIDGQKWFEAAQPSFRPIDTTQLLNAFPFANA